MTYNIEIIRCVLFVTAVFSFFSPISAICSNSQYELIVKTGHIGKVDFLAVSGDESTFLTYGNRDKTLKIYSIPNYDLVQQIKLSEVEKISSIEFDDTGLISIIHNSNKKIYIEKKSIKTGRTEIKTIIDHENNESFEYFSKANIGIFYSGNTLSITQNINGVLTKRKSLKLAINQKATIQGIDVSFKGKYLGVLYSYKQNGEIFSSIDIFDLNTLRTHKSIYIDNYLKVEKIKISEKADAIYIVGKKLTSKEWIISQYSNQKRKHINLYNESIMRFDELMVTFSFSEKGDYLALSKRQRISNPDHPSNKSSFLSNINRRIEKKPDTVEKDIFNLSKEFDILKIISTNTFKVKKEFKIYGTPNLPISFNNPNGVLIQASMKGIVNIYNLGKIDTPEKLYSSEAPHAYIDQIGVLQEDLEINFAKQNSKGDKLLIGCDYYLIMWDLSEVKPVWIKHLSINDYSSPTDAMWIDELSVLIFWADGTISKHLVEESKFVWLAKTSDKSYFATFKMLPDSPYCYFIKNYNYSNSDRIKERSIPLKATISRLDIRNGNIDNEKEKGWSRIFDFCFTKDRILLKGEFWTSSPFLLGALSNSFNGEYCYYNPNSFTFDVVAFPATRSGMRAYFFDEKDYNPPDYEQICLKHNNINNESYRFLIKKNSIDIFDEKEQLATITLIRGIGPLYEDNLEWLIFTPDGFFSSPASTYKNIAIRMGGEIIEMYTLFDAFFRPDLVKNILNKQVYDDGVVAKLDTISSYPPPGIKIVTERVKANQRLVNLKYFISNTGGGIGKMRIYHNGKLIKSSENEESGTIMEEFKRPIKIINQRGINFVSKHKKRIYMEKVENNLKREKEIGNINIELKSGKNIISVCAYNAFNTVQSPFYTKQINGSFLENKSSVYILSVGIDRYLDKTINLKYAKKDALDFSRAFRENLQTLYENHEIEIIDLIDDNADKTKIISELSRLSEKVKINDILILYFAGHGILLDDKFYLVTHNYDGKIDETNLVSENEIFYYLKNAKSLRQLFVVDACHSGGIDNLFSIYYNTRTKIFAQDIGIHFIGSTQSKESALDGFNGNGLFTYALLKALTEGNNTDINNDGFIDVLELSKSAQQSTKLIAKEIGHVQSPFLFNTGDFFKISKIFDSSDKKENYDRTFVDKNTGMHFVFVKGGCFSMGDWTGELPYRLHEVCLDDYFIGKYEVTFDEVRKVCSYGVDKKSDGNLPITIETNCNFIDKMNRKSHKKNLYRLPTEAEWEYACRSRGLNERYCGGNYPNNISWNHYNSDGTPHSVGSLEPNKLGIYDMSGNVRELTQDCWERYYYQNSPKLNPKGPKCERHDSARVVRGGSYKSYKEDYLRSYYRDFYLPVSSDDDIGYRLVYPTR